MIYLFFFSGCTFEAENCKCDARDGKWETGAGEWEAEDRNWSKLNGLQVNNNKREETEKLDWYKSALKRWLFNF